MSARPLTSILKFPTRPRDDLTAAQVVASYLDFKKAEIKAGNYSQDAYAQKDLYLSSFLEFVGRSTLASRLVNADMKRWVMAHAEWKAANTKLDAMGAVCSCFNWAVYEAEIILHAPFRRSAALSGQPEPLPPLEESELRKVLNMARNGPPGRRRKRPSAAAFRVGLFFLWDSGARTKEMRIARIEWMDWQARILVIPKEFNKIGRKTGKPRLIALSPKSMRLIRLLCRGRESGLIFRNGRKGAWRCQTFADQFRLYARMAGVRETARPYTARHGFTVSGIISGKADSKEMADLLGHTSTKQVERVYGASTRFNAGRLTESLDKINAAKARREKPPT